jgi:hypothetical protein
MYQLAPNKIPTNSISNNSNYSNNNTTNKPEEKPEYARINIWIDLENFEIEILKPQYDCFARILNHISNYQHFQYSYYETRKYRNFRPEKNAGKLQLFKYAIEMVIKRIKNNRGAFFCFDLPKNKVKSYEENFMKLFPIYFNDPLLLKANELNLFKNIIESIDIEILYNWTTIAVREIYKKNKIEEKSNKSKGIFSKFFGVKKTDIDSSFNLTKEEEEKIEEILFNSLDEVQNNLKAENKEIKFALNFHLQSGHFKFSNFLNTGNVRHIEGFTFMFSGLDFIWQKCETYSELNSSLEEFVIKMDTIINDRETIIPISFRENKDILNFDQLKKNKNKNNNNKNHQGQLQLQFQGQGQDRDKDKVKENNKEKDKETNLINLNNNNNLNEKVLSIINCEKINLEKEKDLDKVKLKENNNNNNENINTNSNIIINADADYSASDADNNINKEEDFIWKLKIKFFSLGNNVNSEFDFKIVKKNKRKIKEK